MVSQGWALVGVANGRDLGGLLGADGRRVRAGVLIEMRSAQTPGFNCGVSASTSRGQ